MLARPDEEGAGRGGGCEQWGFGERQNRQKDLRVQDFQNLTMLPPTGHNFQGGFYQYWFLTLNNEKHAKWW